MTDEEMRVIRHASATLQSLNRCRKDGLLCDVTINVGEKTYLAHRYVLAVSSEYFRNLFSEDRKEEVVTITDAEPDSIKQCIEYIYTGFMDITTENVASLWETCTKLRLPDIADQCAGYLLSSMNGRRCLLARKLAIKYEHQKLKEAADSYGLMHLEEIAKYQEFLELTKCDLAYFMSSPNNDNVPASGLYDAVISWINHDFKSRSNEFPHLLRFVKLHRFSNKFLLQAIRNEPIFSLYDSSRELLEAELFSRICKSICSPTILLFDSANSCIKAYNIKTRRKCPIRPLNQEVYEDCSAVCFEQFIYVLKGESVYRLNASCQTAKWIRVADMRHKRVGKIQSGVLKHHLFVVGGQVLDDEKVPVASTQGEYYHPSRNAWLTMRQMSIARYSHVVVGCGDFLYCIGGRADNGTILDAMEKYEPTMGVWKSENNPMNRPRAGATAVSHCGRIYVLGGEIELGEITNSVEYYVPLVGTWTIIARMVFPRSCFNAVIFNDKLFAVGGTEEERQKGLVSIETMNLDNNTWTLHDNVAGIGKLETAIVRHL